MSLAKEMINSTFTDKQILNKAIRAESLSKHFKGEYHVLTFSDGSKLLMKKSKLSGTYFSVICDEERLG